MKNLKPEEENIIKDTRSLFSPKKRTKSHCNERYKISFQTRKRN